MTVLEKIKEMNEKELGDFLFLLYDKGKDDGLDGIDLYEWNGHWVKENMAKSEYHNAMEILSE